jgi:hypothetical protein
MRKPLNRPRGSRAGILVLALLLFRAYVPAGFMPADGVPFALELCPAAMAGMPGHLHHHAGVHDQTGTHDQTGAHDHTGSHAQFELCPFGSAPAAGPISHHIDFVSAGPAPSQLRVAFEAPAVTHRAARANPPRGPPSLA